MVEDVGLLAFVDRPCLFLREEIDIDRKSIGCRLLLRHDDVQGCVYVGIGPQIKLDVNTVHLDVCGELRLSFRRQGLYEAVHKRHGLADVRDHVGSAYFQCVYVDVYVLVGPASSAFLHSPPVLERGRDERVWRDHGQGVVPVADLDRVEGYLLDIAVGAAVGHLDPVAEPDHVVLRKLHSGYKSQDAVLEYEHQDGRRGAESGKEHSRGLVYRDSEDDDGSYEIKYDLKALDEAVERVSAVLVRGGVYVEECQKDGVSDHHHYDQYIYDVYAVQDADDVRASFESYVREHVKYDAGHKEKYVVAELSFDQERTPFGRDDPYVVAGNPSEKALYHPVDADADEDHGRYQYCRVEKAGYVGIHVELVYKQSIEPPYYICHVFIPFLKDNSTSVQQTDEKMHLCVEVFSQRFRYTCDMIDNGHIQAPVSAVSRHRIATDGEGVTTLVVFHSCPLRCRWCLNPQTWREGSKFLTLTPQQLLNQVRVDDLYFQATGGGVTFGGGEPSLRSRFICAFREIAPQPWKINIETSLNVPQEHVRRLMEVIDEFVIDIKDMNPQIYKAYTGLDNAQVIENLKLLSSEGLAGRCLIRIPLIPQFNTDEDRENSIRELQNLGFTRFDIFEYLIR